MSSSISNEDRAGDSSRKSSKSTATTRIPIFSISVPSTSLPRNTHERYFLIRAKLPDGAGIRVRSSRAKRSSRGAGPESHSAPNDPANSSSRGNRKSSVSVLASRAKPIWSRHFHRNESNKRRVAKRDQRTDWRDTAHLSRPRRGSRRFASSDPYLRRRSAAEFRSRYIPRKTSGRLARRRPRYEPGGNALACSGLAVRRRSGNPGYPPAPSFARIYEQEIQRSLCSARASRN